MLRPFGISHIFIQKINPTIFPRKSYNPIIPRFVLMYAVYICKHVYPHYPVDNCLRRWSDLGEDVSRLDVKDAKRSFFFSYYIMPKVCSRFRVIRSLTVIVSGYVRASNRRTKRLRVIAPWTHYTRAALHRVIAPRRKKIRCATCAWNCPVLAGHKETSDGRERPGQGTHVEKREERGRRKQQWTADWREISRERERENYTQTTIEIPWDEVREKAPAESEPYEQERKKTEEDRRYTMRTRRKIYTCIYYVVEFL